MPPPIHYLTYAESTLSPKLASSLLSPSARSESPIGGARGGLPFHTTTPFPECANAIRNPLTRLIRHIPSRSSPAVEPHVTRLEVRPLPLARLRNAPGQVSDSPGHHPVVLGVGVRHTADERVGFAAAGLAVRCGARGGGPGRPGQDEG